MHNNVKGNLTTLLMYVWVIVSPFLADYVSQEQFLTLSVAILGLGLAIVNSYYPNAFKFLGNDGNAEYINEVFGIDKILNDEYEVELDDSEA